MLWVGYAKQVLQRGFANASAVVIAHSWKQLLVKAATVSAVLALLLFYTQATKADDRSLFSDEVTLVLLAISASAFLVLSLFLAQLLFVAPYQLWKEACARVPVIPDFVRAEDAGRWLYENGSEKLRTVLRSNVPELWPSIADCGRDYVIDAAKGGGIKLFARREEGLSWEEVSISECDFGTFEQVFGVNGRRKMDIAVRKESLAAILAYYAT